MGSKVSKAKRPTFAKTKAVTIPIIPQDKVPIIVQDTISMIPHDIIIEIFDHLASDSDLRSLQACALVSKPWVQPCRYHLFHTVIFTPASAREWLKMFPVQEASPAYHVRDLCLQIGEEYPIPEKFFECIPWFTDASRMTLSGYGGFPLEYGGFSPLREPSFWKIPRSVTSLTINTGAVTLVQVRDIMAQLPNLNDLELSGYLAEVDRGKLPGIGTILKGRFGGRLMLREASEDIINMLLEIPSGLRFVELEIHCARNRLPSAIRLSEANGATLVKLSYTANFYCGSYRFRLTPTWDNNVSTLTHSPDAIRHDTIERSFDLSKFPNLQDVTFRVMAYWWGEDITWIPMALSTLRPTTSPHLSTITLDFCSSITQPVEPVTTGMDNDLQRIAGEVARMECEFKGAVKFIVFLDSRFEAALDSLNVRFYCFFWKRPLGHVDLYSFFPCRSFDTTFIEIGRLSLPLAFLHVNIVWIE